MPNENRSVLSKFQMLSGLVQSDFGDRLQVTVLGQDKQGECRLFTEEKEFLCQP